MDRRGLTFQLSKFQLILTVILKKLVFLLGLLMPSKFALHY
jgi:hypothetical protein